MWVGIFFFWIRTKWALISRVCCLGRGKHHNELYRKREDSRILLFFSYVSFAIYSVYFAVSLSLSLSLYGLYVYVYMCLRLFFVVVIVVVFFQFRFRYSVLHLFKKTGSVTVWTCVRISVCVCLYILFLFSALIRVSLTERMAHMYTLTHTRTDTVPFIDENPHKIEWANGERVGNGRIRESNTNKNMWTRERVEW